MQHLDLSTWQSFIRRHLIAERTQHYKRRATSNGGAEKPKRQTHKQGQSTPDEMQQMKNQVGEMRRPGRLDS
jgi:hypothetical protein